jgi:hypothetical protein
MKLSEVKKRYDVFYISNVPIRRGMKDYLTHLPVRLTQQMIDKFNFYGRIVYFQMKAIQNEPE